jgi:hypothetical protein
LIFRNVTYDRSVIPDPAGDGHGIDPQGRLVYEITRVIWPNPTAHHVGWILDITEDSRVIAAPEAGFEDDLGFPER